MPLDDRVFVARRFQRSVRIDTDLGDPSALEGFVCPRSSAVVLETMAKHVAESGQGAFTWTGPYGSGKSSLVVALSALLHGESAIRSEAGSLIGRDTAKAVWEAFPPRTKGLAYSAGRRPSRPPGAFDSGGDRDSTADEMETPRELDRKAGPCFAVRHRRTRPSVIGRFDGVHRRDGKGAGGRHAGRFRRLLSPTTRRDGIPQQGASYRGRYPPSSL